MPMERMCSCQLDEALWRPHPSPCLRSTDLEFGNSLECGGPQPGSEAAGSGSPESPECGKRHLAEDSGYCRMLQNTEKHKHRKIIPSDYDLPEITTVVTL